MKKITLFSLMCCLGLVGTSFGAGGCKLTTCTSGGDHGKYGNLLQATTGEVGWSFSDGQCYRCNWGDNDYECDEGTTFAVKHKDFWLTGQIKKFVKCSDEGEADDDWVSYNPTTTCNPAEVKDDLKKLSEGLKRDYVIISGVDHSDPFYLLGGGKKTGFKQNTTGDNVILVTGNDGCVVYLCEKGYKASEDRRECVRDGGKQKDDGGEKDDPNPNPNPNPNPKDCPEGTTRATKNISIIGVCTGELCTPIVNGQCYNTDFLKCMEAADRGEPANWNGKSCNCGDRMVWDNKSYKCIAKGDGGTTIKRRTCKELYGNYPERLACCEAGKATKWTGTVREGTCSCVDTTKVWDSAKKQCIEKQVPEEDCIYSFDVEIKCSTLTYKYKETVPLTKEQLGTHKCDEFNKLFATDANKYKELFGDPCKSSEPEPLTSVPETPVDTGPSEYALNSAKKTLEAFSIRAEDERSVWRNAEGNFNTARLASDITAGVVLGTVGGVVTGVVIKKNQVKKGFEALHCTVGGQKVAEWGDEFSVGLRR